VHGVDAVTRQALDVDVDVLQATSLHPSRELDERVEAADAVPGPPAEGDQGDEDAQRAANAIVAEISSGDGARCFEADAVKGNRDQLPVCGVEM
jgi:hypothetical protein